MEMWLYLKKCEDSILKLRHFSGKFRLEVIKKVYLLNRILSVKML